MPFGLKQAAPAASASPYPPFIDFLSIWDEDPSSLPTSPKRRPIFANFLTTSSALVELGDRLPVAVCWHLQSEAKTETEQGKISFARHEKFDYLTLLELLKVAASCRCARRSRHPRGMPLRGGED